MNNLLSNTDEINSVIKDNELESQGVKIPLTKNTKFIIQADLRQNYFHSIESFFEFLFAFLPNKGKVPDNRNILRALVKSNWSQNYKKIEYIANGKMKLNFLDEMIDFLDHKVSVGHYLFYVGTFSKEKFNEEYQESVKKSIESIKKIIKTIAIDFSKRDEYNAYKHTMRVFPSFNSIHILDANTMEEQMNFDLSNSASYQIYNDKEKETIVKTKLFDPERDFKMTRICSRLIYNMVELRSIVFGDKKGKNENEKVALILFNQENIEDSIKHNVKIQDLSFSSKLVKGSS
ncbi:hypothetical protein [Tenacibaculum finnmarkense]|uniref:hypothetical protein n=1 Tax=Tenacibaculum finnmarkense TaxID=2781243 RepID=UPI001E53F01F|nr:hypothetical protein [Tenacibaculum finnmarkense]MCD8418731.1 hypothetical protein [Tenacibaculum finnmarkense genomovar finnmarkense]MCG8187041.1 hypothetical protein [Tenacibaculum finnmarkense genomovar finnmarkense]MCG8203550.1 hypothetical protein [Tenacibaculum finnmarkense genomovar finnmarkense]MCG8211073.1 hypothetical protein [Tenacibaculum finnmarkense genomovar finnmarkense]MCG8221190.1 hypothetical protein [Tenacibaculum finnmarkense genomovar finnmarkense]